MTKPKEKQMDLELEILFLKKEILELKYGKNRDKLSLRYNQNHDPGTGRFTSGPGGSGSAASDSINHLQGTAYADAVVKRYIDNPKSLGDTTPQEKYDDFIAHGVNPIPLGHGSADGVAYESGGGYRVPGLPDGGCFLYHPEKGSHHGGEYYKIATGKSGKRRYNMKGEPIIT